MSGLVVQFNSEMSAALLNANILSEKEKEMGRPNKRKLRRKQVPIKTFKIYEKNQEGNKTHKTTKLLLETVVKRQSHTKPPPHGTLT